MPPKVWPRYIYTISNTRQMPIVNNMKYVHERRHFIGQAADDDLAKATSLIVKKTKLNVTTAIDKKE